MTALSQRGKLTTLRSLAGNLLACSAHQHLRYDHCKPSVYLNNASFICRIVTTRSSSSVGSHFGLAGVSPDGWNSVGFRRFYTLYVAFRFTSRNVLLVTVDDKRKWCRWDGWCYLTSSCTFSSNVYIFTAHSTSIRYLYFTGRIDWLKREKDRKKYPR